MTTMPSQLLNVKNRWLWQQVEVDYPTPESIRGRQVYESLSQKASAIPFTDSPSHQQSLHPNVLAADFHRMTIMFSLLQANRVTAPEEKEALVEFFTQIIYSEPCTLYLGFSQGEAVAAALLTIDDNQWLISDVVMCDNQEFSHSDVFINQVIANHSAQCSVCPERVWLESFGENASPELM
ncbi:hypothetical protein F9817_18425 [Vibrio sp. CAIM 722]|uniref:Uncharacterized protein n=1 Tax=Vibrio eleionomae TaxID=2653505 RepID=A0A7X4LNC5_9VIBR|nr:hypothetical protein [Vibrio eleionomae]MZI95158.1 hypothetical protein [Vibrio eleionomae]